MREGVAWGVQSDCDEVAIPLRNASSPFLTCGYVHEHPISFIKMSYEALSNDSMFQDVNHPATTVP